MSEIVPRPFDLSGLRFEQSKSGHVRTPWFTFPMTEQMLRDGPYSYGSRYHQIKHMATEAFRDALKITGEGGVIIHEKRDNGSFEIWWMLSTVEPCELPRPKLAKPTDPLAIDI